MLNRKHLKKKKEGFTLIELMIVVAIIGVLIALALPAFRNYFYRTKTAEVGPNLRNMYTGAVAYYNGEAATNRGTAVTDARTHCVIRGQGLIGTETDQKQDISTAVAASDSFRAMNFSLADPVYYSYGFTSTPGCTGAPSAEVYAFQAQGDLDNDGSPALYELLAGINADHDLFRAPSVYVPPGSELE